MGNLISEHYNNLRRTDPTQWKEKMRPSAIHEAGHAAVQIFLGQTPEDIVKISLVGNEGGPGRVQRDCQCNPFSLPEPWKSHCVLRQICITLAGRVAEDELIEGTNSLDGSEVLDPDSEDWDISGADLHSAAYFAKMISRKYKTKGQILKRAERWTRELIREPLVKSLILSCADILLEKQEIRKEEALQIFDPINGLARENRRFRRALWASEAERKCYYW